MHWILTYNDSRFEINISLQPCNWLFEYELLKRENNKSTKIFSKASIDILCLDKTKFDSSFIETQFKINGYQHPPIRRDRNSKVVVKLYLSGRVLSQKAYKIKTKTAETSQTKQGAFFWHIARQSLIKTTFSMKFQICWTNFPISTSHLYDLNDVFNGENLVKEIACFKSNRGTLIDIILTNKTRSYKKARNFVTSISHCNKLILTILWGTKNCYL